jgi:hypothetical protein
MLAFMLVAIPMTNAIGNSFYPDMEASIPAPGARALDRDSP